MARPCDLQCDFFQATKKDSKLAEMAQLYCRGSLVEACRRRELYLSGNTPPQGMTPKGSGTDD